MGRELKRVPLDFDWPRDEIWEGYIRPTDGRKECPSCGGGGYSPQAKLFHDQWYGYAPFDPIAYGSTPLTVEHPNVLAFATRNYDSNPEFYGRGWGGRRKLAIAMEAERLFQHWSPQWGTQLNQEDVDALVAADRLHDFVRRPRNEEQAAELRQTGRYWLAEQNGYRPTAAEVNAWSIGGGMGHDSINCHVCITARCEREGVPVTCDLCDGHGEVFESPEAEAANAAWQPSEPPTGEGFQLWTTTNEGAPLSPVFETLDQLCEWCEHNATTFGRATATAAEWRKMLDGGLVAHTVERADGSSMVFL